jgi:energy-coupling factor transporter ATP-binding protein EcfA2
MTDGPSTKIIKLKIQSFRFFQKEESFDFEGKNALIYGENGSGKSSVFKALEILSKGKVNEKDVNIFSDEPVSITYLFDNNESEDLIINESTAIDEPFYFVKKLSVYNPFLDYKQLLKIHFSMNIGESVNILPVLKQILRSYPVEDGKVLSDITKPSEYHEKLKNILNVELIKEINDFLKLLDTDYTIESFFFDEKFVEGKSETVAILKILWKERELSQNYEGIFNEARLTAISCAIYFSAIKKLSEILEEGALKILLLDDILISLDMSNRYGLLKAIYEKFADFQIFIFTHDKVLFEYIKDMEKPGEWKNFEMYVDDRLEIEKPYVIPNIDYFQKAEKYLINRDYSACANYLRKELERLLKKSVCIQPCNDHLSLEDLVHRIEVKDVYKELAGKAQGFAKQPNIKEFAEKDESNENLKEIKGRIKTLITAVENFEKNCTNDVDAKQIIDDLMKFKNYILNPQSHDDSNKPLFKKELDETVKKIINLDC